MGLYAHISKNEESNNIKEFIIATKNTRDPILKRGNIVKSCYQYQTDFFTQELLDVFKNILFTKFGNKISEGKPLYNTTINEVIGTYDYSRLLDFKCMVRTKYLSGSARWSDIEIPFFMLEYGFHIEKSVDIKHPTLEEVDELLYEYRDKISSKRIINIRKLLLDKSKYEIKIGTGFKKSIKDYINDNEYTNGGMLYRYILEKDYPDDIEKAIKDCRCIKHRDAISPKLTYVNFLLNYFGFRIVIHQFGDDVKYDVCAKYIPEPNPLVSDDEKQLANDIKNAYKRD